MVQVPGLPAPIENMILRYVKQKADWWTQVVRPRLVHTSALCVPMHACAVFTCCVHAGLLMHTSINQATQNLLCFLLYM